MTAKSIRQQFADTLLEVGKEDERLVVLLGDISHFILQPFANACPSRFYNVGICEPTIVSMAAGMAKVGLIPVAHTIAPFIIERSFEQIKLDFCYHRLGGNLVTVGSAFDYSNLGCTHHCYGDFAMLKTLEDAEIVHPATPQEFDLLFRQCYADGRLTVYRIPGRQHGQEIAPSDIRFGHGVKLTEGRDLTIVATGPQLGTAMGARDGLRALGYEPEVLYFHTIRPLDVGLIRASAAKTRRVLVVEEHMRSGGLGDDVLRATQDIWGVQHSSLSIPDAFIREYGHYEDHCQRLGFTPPGLLARVQADFGALN